MKFFDLENILSLSFFGHNNMVYKLRSSSPNGYATRSSKHHSSFRKSAKVDANNNINTTTASKNKGFRANTGGYAFRKRNNDNVLLDSLHVMPTIPTGVIRPIPRKSKPPSIENENLSKKPATRRNRIRSIDDILDKNPIPPVHPRQALIKEQQKDSFLTDKSLNNNSLIPFTKQNKQSSFMTDRDFEKKPIHPRQSLTRKGNKENCFREGENE